MTEVGTRDIPPLNWDVLVTPGIPIATSDLHAGMKQAMFQAIASTLIYGKRDLQSRLILVTCYRKPNREVNACLYIHTYITTITLDFS